MATVSTVTLADLIEETLDLLHRVGERPKRIVMGANDLTSAVDTTLTLTDGSTPTQTQMLLEFGDELMLVTAKSSDTVPVFTVARGYLGPAASSAIPNGTVGNLNPAYPRYQVRRAVERCIKALESPKGLPNITSGVFTRDTDKQYIEMPATTVDVFEVGHLNVITGRFDVISGWRFFEDMPVSQIATGKILRLPSVVSDADELVVKYQAPYAWSDSTEAATIDLPLGGEDLPALFAVSRIVTGREISRGEIDKVEEWNHEAAVRGGVNLRQIQALWADYYRRLDEVRSSQNVPKNRPYRKIARTIP